MNETNTIIYNTVRNKASVSLLAKDGMVWMKSSHSSKKSELK